MKLIAIDLDGTLLNHHHEISKENISAIKNAKSKGTQVVIATGRTYFDALAICKNAGIDKYITYILSSHGGCIHSIDGKLISSIPMNKEDISIIAQWLEENNFYYEVYANNTIYSCISGKNILKEELNYLEKSNTKLNIPKIKQTLQLQDNQSKFTYINSYDEINNINNNLFGVLALSFDDIKRKKGAKQFENMKSVSSFSSWDYNFEFIDVKASKGNGLEKLCHMLNISLDDVMAIGDNYNDISMLEKANYSVAMGNASDYIKSLCKFTTHSNDNHGVAYIINEFFNSKLADISLA